MPHTRYHWLPNLDCVMHETDEHGDTTVEYAHEPTYYGPLLSERREETDHVHHFDALGSTIALSDETGDIIDTFGYDAWGTILTRSGSTNTAYTWLGRWGYFKTYDSDTFTIRMRQYTPSIARWNSKDPVFRTLGTGFEYCTNAPIDNTDPSGLVVSDIEPMNVQGMPWCKVGTYNPGASAPPPGTGKLGRYVPHDPMGLPPNVYGRTDPSPFSISCRCVCCSPSDNNYAVQCTVRVRLRIRIAPAHVKVMSIEEVYGHEQLHVYNLLIVARETARDAGAWEQTVGCTDRDHCEQMATFITRFEQGLMDEFVRREEAHSWPHGPAAGTGYPPTGRMPEESDCSLPSTAKAVPTTTSACPCLPARIVSPTPWL